MTEKIAVVMKKVGISPSLLGYKYITEAIKMVLEDDSIIDGVTTRLYPDIARKFNTIPSRVERAIRHAIECSFSNMPKGMIFAIFGNTISPEKGKATNSEFIATISRLITDEPNNPFWSM